MVGVNLALPYIEVLCMKLLPMVVLPLLTVHAYGYHVLCVPHSRLHAVQYTMSQCPQCASVCMHWW